MRNLHIRDGAKEAARNLRGAWGLVKQHPAATVALGFALSVLPQVFRGLLRMDALSSLLSTWERWASGALSQQSLTLLINTTLQSGGRMAFGTTMWDLIVSLALTPLLLSSLALCFNGFVRASGYGEAVESVRTAGRGVKNLVIISLLCMLAAWFSQVVPSIASGLTSAAAGILSFIPIVGTIADILAIALSLLVSLLTDFALTVVFVYVWICAACEGIPGVGALVRSWQYTRNAARETVSSVLALALLRWLTVLALGALWYFAGRRIGVSLQALVLLTYAVGGLHGIALGATTSALYQNRTGYGVHAYADREPIDFAHMKRANLDDDPRGKDNE